MKKQVKIGLGAAALALAAALCAGGTLAHVKHRDQPHFHCHSAGHRRGKIRAGADDHAGADGRKVRLGEKYRHSQLPCAGQSGD